ncbi:hypothetical protein [Oryza sativa Japonica Group]|uniref:Uncharacterized protein n=1 Tax=Oryza sativa subsp. japonica TaxID=39947 RepID=Q5JNU6_ORYSJ|nr:hypothetical protein [Oryza sativa Japonica Group]
MADKAVTASDMAVIPLEVVIDDDEIEYASRDTPGGSGPAQAEPLLPTNLAEEDFQDAFILFVDMRITAHFATAYNTPASDTPARIITKTMEAAHPTATFKLVASSRGTMALRFASRADRETAVLNQEGLESLRFVKDKIQSQVVFVLMVSEN